MSQEAGDLGKWEKRIKAKKMFWKSVVAKTVHVGMREGWTRAGDNKVK